MGTVEPLPQWRWTDSPTTLSGNRFGPPGPSNEEVARLKAGTADLEARAAKIWPDGEPHAEHNRREWIRAVGVVRATRRGWVADLMARKVAH